MKKLVLLLVFLVAFCGNAWAATKYARAGGGNWSADATWSTTSGGAADTTKCVAADACYLDANSGNVTVDAASAAGSLDCTGYTGTLTLGANLTVSGSLTLVSGMTFTPSTYTTIMNATGTITSGGKSFYAFSFTMSGGQTVTLADDMTVNNTLTINTVNGGYHNLNGNTLHAKGDITYPFANCEINGTTVISIDGTGNQTFTSSHSSVSYLNYLPITINKGGGTLYFSGTLGHKTGTITYTAGTVDTLTNKHTLKIYGSCTLNTDGIDWYNITFSATNTTTLSSDLNVTNLITVTGNTGFSGAYDINLEGNLTYTAQVHFGNTGAVSATLNFMGTSDQTLGYSEGSHTYNWLSLNVEINKPSGDFILGSTNPLIYAYYKSGATWTYTTADAFNAGTSVFYSGNNTTITSNGSSFYDFRTYGANKVVTLADDLYIGNDFINGATTGFAGAFNIHVKHDVTWVAQAHIGYLTDNVPKLIFDGTGNQILGTSGSTYNWLSLDVEINKASGTFTLGSVVPLRYGYYKSGAKFDYVTADSFSAGTSLFHTQNNVNLDFNGETLYDLQISQAGTATLDSNATVGHTLTIDTSRTLALGSNTLTVLGDVANNGAFNTGTGNVTLDGAAATQTFSGNGIDFYDFEYISSEAKEIVFQSTKTYGFSNSITLIKPYGGSAVVLSASTEDTVANFDIDGATQNIERLDIYDIASVTDTGHNYKGTQDAESTGWDSECSVTPTPTTTACGWVA